jgi:predicted flap endonuclease-1-like 5' DNA nuclease
MAVAVKDLKGASAALAKKLKQQGIGNADKLLAAAATPAGRKALAASCGCDAKVILELANRADLSRISGIAGVYSDLLERAGVDTVKELSKRKADNLHAKIVETNQASGLTKQPPGAARVASWVDQAKALPKVLTY